MSDEYDIGEIGVDDLWLQELAEELVREIEDYLGKRAAFDEFLRGQGEL